MAQETHWTQGLRYLEPDGEGYDLLLASPPRLLRTSLYLMVFLIAAAAVWAWFSKVDIYITSVGAVRPEGDLVKVQSFASGRVISAEVTDGELVKAGDLLFELDQRDSQTALQQVENELQGTRQRRQARERSFESLISEHQAEARSARIAIENAEVGLTRAQEERRALAAGLEEAEEVLQAARLDMDRKQSLFDSGVIADVELQAATTRLRIAESSKRSAEADLEVAGQMVASAEKTHQLVEQQAEVGKRERERQSEALSSEIGLLKENEKRLELEQQRLLDSLDFLQIRAPVDGVVTTVGARNAGEVVQLGMTLATVAPADTPWIVESWVSNRDAGPLRDNLGARVKLKFDAFPFRDYGSLDGQLVEISPDAEFSPVLGDAYRVRITMDALQLGRGNRQGHVRLGMAVTADIVKEEERILMLLFRKVRDRVSYE